MQSMDIDWRAIAAGAGVLAAAWQRIAAIKAKSAKSALAIQLQTWEILIHHLETMLDASLRREDHLRTQLSSARTENVALHKIITGEYPNPHSTLPAPAALPMPSDLGPHAAGADPFP